MSNTCRPMRELLPNGQVTNMWNSYVDIQVTYERCVTHHVGHETKTWQNLEGNVSWTDTCQPSDEMSKTYDGTVTAQAERTEGLVTERVVQVHGRRGLSQPHRNTTAWNSQAFFVTMQRSLCINGCSLKANNFCFPYKKQNFFQKYPCAWTLPRVQRYFLFFFCPEPLWQSGEFYEPPSQNNAQMHLTCIT